MAKNIDRLEENKALVESKMRRLVDLLVEFNKAVRAFGKKGWMKRAWKMRGHVHSLGRLDKEIVAQLDVFRDVYKLATDNESMKRIYKIEASIDKLVAERVRQTGEPEGKVVAVLSNDPVAIASVAVDARVPPAELTSELSEFRLEVKAGLSNLDKKMQQMLDGKQGDREEIAKVLAAVKAGVSRDEKLLAAVEAGAARDKKLLAAVEAGAARDKKLAAAVQRDSKKLDNLNAAVREGLQRDESLKKRIAQGLEKKSKKDFVRQIKDNQLEQFEVEPDYVEDKPFARGGEGEVFMGEYQGDTIVLKKMSLVGVTATKRQKMLNSFKSELAIMVRLRSPRVAHFYGVVTTDTTFLGLVMEYCAGGSLRAFLDGESGKVTADLQRVWGLDVALGMAYLYSQGVEHRDLKALNVLLTSDLRGKVTDFGLSKCDDLRTGTQTTQGGGAAGTSAFMAPELLEDNTFTEKSDVYSYAIVLWEIWSRQVPWSDLRPMQIMRKVVDKRERPPVPAGMPAELRELMVRSWVHQPADRPDFAEIEAQLKASTPRRAPGGPARWGSGAVDAERDSAQGVTGRVFGGWLG